MIIPRTVKTITFVIAGIVALPGYGQTEKKKNVFTHPDLFYQKYFPKMKIKRVPTDSSYIRSYPNDLTSGIHVLSPDIHLRIKSRSVKANGKNAATHFVTTIPDIIGFSLSYRFVTAGFAFLLPNWDKDDHYVTSAYRTATIKFNNPVYSLQFKYLRLKGLTDINPNNSPAADQYVKRPDLVVKEYQFESVYNFGWKRYSYIAPLTFSQRQLISRAGFLLKGGVYYTNLAGDSSLIGKKQQPSYEDFNNNQGLRTLSVRIAPGFGGNLVFFKRFYLSAAAFTSYDFYSYRYLQTDQGLSAGRQAFALTLSGLSSVGFQSRRFYAGIRYEAQQSTAALHSINIQSRYNYVGVELGYRFHAPRVIKKVYKETMPPGL